VTNASPEPFKIRLLRLALLQVAILTATAGCENDISENPSAQPDAPATAPVEQSVQRAVYALIGTNRRPRAFLQ
jgi:hypothetical protein